MNSCPYCGSQFEGDSCPNCGASTVKNESQSRKNQQPTNKQSTKKTNKITKPMKIRLWMIGIICCSSIIIFINIKPSSVPVNNSKIETNSISSTELNKKKETTKATTKRTIYTEPYNVQLCSGHYTAGIDIPAGTYNLTAIKGKGNVNSINSGLNLVMGIDNSNLFQKEYKNAKLTDGDILSISNVTIKIESNAAQTKNMKNRTNSATKEIELCSGNYEAGTDFPVGTYDIEAIEGFGNVISNNYFSGGLNAVMGVGNNALFINEFKNAYFKKGDTLKVNQVKIKLIPSK